MLWRGFLSLAIPKDVWDSIPIAKKVAFRDAVLAIKACAVKINEGQASEEITIKASWHWCGHDDGKPCEPEQEI